MCQTPHVSPHLASDTSTRGLTHRQLTELAPEARGRGRKEEERLKKPAVVERVETGRERNSWGQQGQEEASVVGRR